MVVKVRDAGPTLEDGCLLAEIVRLPANHVSVTWSCRPVPLVPLDLAACPTPKLVLWATPTDRNATLKQRCGQFVLHLKKTNLCLRVVVFYQK